MKVIEGGKEPAGKRKLNRLSNYIEVTVKLPDGKTKDKRIPKKVDQVAYELVKLTGGWPKRVFRRLFTIDGRGDVRWIDSPSALFSEIGGRFGIELAWSQRIESAVTKNELHEFLTAESEFYEGVASLPHYPPRPELFYNLPRGFDKIKSEGKLDAFIDFFSPATPQDRSLIKAAIMTPFSGIDGGTRPAFMFEGEEDPNGGKGCGTGKSTLVDLIGKLAGGTIDVNHSKFDEVQRSIVNSHGKRIVRLDNMKSSRLSSSELEKVLTSYEISSHQLYVGTVEIKNLFSYYFTMNQSNLSQDLAQRVVRVLLAKPRHYIPDWEKQVNEFLREHRLEIIWEAIETLKNPERPFTKYFRYATWQADVLSKIENSDTIIDLINERQGEVDDERGDSESIDESIAFKLSEYRVPSTMSYGSRDADPGKDSFIIVNQLMARWIGEVQGRKGMSNNMAARVINRLSKRLTKIKFEQFSAWVWNRVEGHEGGYLIKSDNNYHTLEYKRFPTRTLKQ